jgi:MFS family permease
MTATAAPATGPNPGTAAEPIDSGEPALPSRAYAWTIVAILSIAYAFSLLDRWVLTLLVQPMKASLGISDTSMGLLMGPVFSFVYIFLGLPFGWIADRYNRRNLIAVGMSFWCAMTAASGVARTFGQLAVARFGIGIGEATLTPAATSIIADSFPRTTVNSALGVFNLGIYAGMGLSYLIGGMLLAWATTQSATVWPVTGQLEPWQIVFISVGLPGLLVVALLLAVIREPKRTKKVVAGQDVSFRACFAFVGEHIRAYAPLGVGAGAVALTGYAFNWLPTLFTRTWGWAAPEFSFYYGMILIVLGPAGAVSSGFIANKLYAQGYKDAPFRVMCAGLPVLVIVGGLMPLAPRPEIALAMLAVAAYATSLSTSSGIASVVFATPPRYRGRVLALYTMTNATLGTTVGPTLVGYLSDHVFMGADGIRYAMTTVVLGIGGTLVAFLLTGRRHYDRLVRAVEAEG